MTWAFEAAPGPRDPGFEAAVDALTLKARGARRPAIDWSIDPIRPRWASTRAYTEAVSQLLHAERATRTACAHLVSALPEPAAARFIESQAADEARHARMYTRYLWRLGDIAPMDEALAAALDGALGWHHSPAAMMVAFSVVLEGEAVHLHGAAARAFPCPLLRRVATSVGRDEARHTAFGRLYLTHALAARGIEERRAIYRDVEALWRAVARPSARDGTRGAILRRAWRGYMAARWRTHRRTFARIGLIRPGEDFDR